MLTEMLFLCPCRNLFDIIFLFSKKRGGGRLRCGGVCMAQSLDSEGHARDKLGGRSKIARGDDPHVPR